MTNPFLVITSIAADDHPVLRKFSEKTKELDIPFILIGDTKSPEKFELDGCDFYSVDRQLSLSHEISKALPVKHYSRKNIGYLEAISQGAGVIIETDDDNYPYDSFWDTRVREQQAVLLDNKGWTNVYRYFADVNIWPRGFALEQLQQPLPETGKQITLNCPIQQGLADENPDVDAIYRLILPLPLKFNQSESIALGPESICPFNSQNTTWFREAFPLLYLPSYCSFRMTDIWRSFVAQRIAWTCGWPILFHKSTVWQERNDHDLMVDFQDEVPGYNNNYKMMSVLSGLDLRPGVENIKENLESCYRALIDNGWVGSEELKLVQLWNRSISDLL